MGKDQETIIYNGKPAEVSSKLTIKNDEEFVPLSFQLSSIKSPGIVGVVNRVIARAFRQKDVDILALRKHISDFINGEFDD